MRDQATETENNIGPKNTPTNPGTDTELNNFRARYFLFVFFLVTILLGLVLWPFWQLLVLAFLLAGIFRPVYSHLLRRIPPWFSSLLTCMLITLIVFIPLMFCIGALSTEALNLYQLGKDSNVLLKIQHLLQNNTLAMEAQEVLARYNINFKPEDITGMISSLARTMGLFIYNQASTWAGNIMSFALQFCILILVTFFLFMELDRLLAFLKKLSPLPNEQTDTLMTKFMEISGAILVGNGISGVFQGFLGGALFAILGLKSPVLWGGIMAILAFLPIFGIGLVLIPTSLILALNGYIGQGLVTFSFYMILSFSVEYLAKPKFVGDHVQMHTLLVFLAIIGGMSVFGVLGIIYGPLIVTAFLSLSEIYLQNYAVNSGEI
ncbi:MAG: AI-2E family transporter [Desulfobulbaceae bacterium]|nr:AI-2E family transporter [Desulfobulbaceae bacterium]